jgi:membrane-bound lytic murein transglycosylase B
MSRLFRLHACARLAAAAGLLAAAALADAATARPRGPAGPMDIVVDSLYPPPASVGPASAASAADAASAPAAARDAKIRAKASTRKAPPTKAAAAASAAPATVATTTSAKTPARKKSSAQARDDEAPDSVLYGRREDVTAFAAQVAEERGLDREWVESQLARARYQPAIVQAVLPAPSGSPKNWAAYRARFLEPKRVAAGAQWWRAHEQALADAQARYGVPPSLVAGVLGVETFYGRLVGRWRVLDALATLSFDFPAGRSDRSAFYRSELRAYLVWCALENRDADSVRGSFAGAIGWPQFMPSSLLKFAVDFDRDGHVDLASGGDDVVGSVAAYLAAFGWQRGAPAWFPATPPVDDAARARLLAPDIVPSFTAAEMAAAGARLPDEAMAYPGKLALVKLDNGDDTPTYVAGTDNFYVVTRYNWSSYYAMAVIALAEAVEREHALGPAAPASAPVSTRAP